jgi:hypothetical protein
MNHPRWLAGIPLAVLAIAGAPGAAGAQTVKVTVPAGVSFNVIDAASSTNGTSGTTLSWSNPQGFNNPDHLRVLIRAATANFAGPGSTHPAASKVSWTTTASSGTPSNGTMSSAAFTVVWLSATKLKNVDSGTISQTWTLAPIYAAGLRSGTHTLSVTWRFEVF